MPTVTFIEPSGCVRSVDAKISYSLMEVAIANRVVGVLAECGGACACATCHVHIDPAWADRLAPAEPFEAALLAEALKPSEYSRLACQITITNELDGLVVRVAERQV